MPRFRHINAIVLGALLAVQVSLASAACEWIGIMPGSLPETFPDPNAWMNQKAQERFDFIVANFGCQAPDVDGRFREPSSTVIISETFTQVTPDGKISGFGCPQDTDNVSTGCSREVEFQYATGTVCARIFFEVAAYQCEVGNGQYVITVTPLDEEAESAAAITSVEPDGITKTLVAKVFNADTGEVVPDVDVQLEVDAVAGSGGHIHHDAGRPKGEFVMMSSGQLNADGTVLTGNTSADGLVFRFKAPEAAGDHTLIASCDGLLCEQQGPLTVFVGVKGLDPLPPLQAYVLLEEHDLEHNGRHYMTPRAIQKLTRLAEVYRKKFPNNPPLQLGDASLEYGGLFDFDFGGRTLFWEPLHERHRQGLNIDVLANPDLQPDAVPKENFPAFSVLATLEGCSVEVHEDGTPEQHFHVTCR